MGHTNNAVVVGAGISGLACAFRLEQLGIRPLLLEASGSVGGVISTISRNGFIFEGGPQCPRFPEPVWKLVRELNLEHEFLAGNPKAKRYILRGGRLHLAPFSVGSLLSTRLVGLESKSRVLSEAFRHSQPPSREESLAEFVQRKFGAEVLDYLVDPFVSTVFFADAHKMGMESAFPALVEWERSGGSVARGAIRAYRSKHSLRLPNDSARPARSNSGKLVITEALPTLGSFRSGMGTLPQELASALKEPIRFLAKAEAATIATNPNDGTQSGWRLRLTSGEEIFTAALVMALPAYAAAPLFKQSAPNLSFLLDGIEHSPLFIVSCAYNRDQVRHPLDGFGFMVPRHEGLNTICTFWNSSLFPGRAPDGTVLMTSYARHETAAGLINVSDEALSQTVEAENAKLLGITGTPVSRAIWNYQHALPQYNVGHSQRIAQIGQSVAELRGLYLAGNFLKGRSIGDCAQAGIRAAEDLHSHLRN
jgi:oxygen-dependent protoporphyrinogen oxidase